MTDTKNKTVRLDSEVMDELAQRRNGFETPNDCIKRLLVNTPCTQEKTKEEDEEDDNS